VTGTSKADDILANSSSHLNSQLRRLADKALLQAVMEVLPPEALPSSRHIQEDLKEDSNNSLVARNREDT
jgi:hypothetical protein